MMYLAQSFIKTLLTRLKKKQWFYDSETEWIGGDGSIFL